MRVEPPLARNTPLMNIGPAYLILLGVRHLGRAGRGGLTFTLALQLIHYIG